MYMMRGAGLVEQLFNTKIGEVDGHSAGILVKYYIWNGDFIRDA